MSRISSLGLIEIPSHFLPHISGYIRSYRTKKERICPVTKVLQDNKLLYRWDFPTKLLVMHQGQQVAITSLKESYKQLHNWELIPTPSSNVTRHNTPHNPQHTQKMAERKNQRSSLPYPLLLAILVGLPQWGIFLPLIHPGSLASPYISSHTPISKCVKHMFSSRLLLILLLYCISHA